MRDDEWETIKDLVESHSVLLHNIQAMVEKQATLTQDLRFNAVLLDQIKQISEEHLSIAREYKRSIGDPLRHGVWFLKMLRNVIAIIVGALLSGWGFWEWFNGVVVKKP